MVGLQSQQRVRVYRLYTQIDNQDVRRMQICVDHQLVIDDSCVRAVNSGNEHAHCSFEINVWPSRFALFEAVGGEMIRVPQEDAVLEMEAPSYFTWD
jgi:hypothetical protein